VSQAASTTCQAVIQALTEVSQAASTTCQAVVQALTEVSQVPGAKPSFKQNCNPTDISASPRNNGAALPTPLLQQKGLVACYQQKITEDNLYSE
jgi:hypothetical protein